MRGLLRLAQGDRDAADEHIDRVLRRSPGSWEAHLAKARVLYERDRIAEALAEIRLASPQPRRRGRAVDRQDRRAQRQAAGGRRRVSPRAPARPLAARGRRSSSAAPSSPRASPARPSPSCRPSRAPAEVPRRPPRPRPRAPRARAAPRGPAELHPRADHDPNPDEALYWAGRTAAELGRHAEAVPARPRSRPGRRRHPLAGRRAAVARPLAASPRPQARGPRRVHGLSAARGPDGHGPRRGREAAARALKPWTRRGACPYSRAPEEWPSGLRQRT
jgi:hypothetical protein